VIFADLGVNLVIQKGLQISRSTIRWYDHIDLWSLEDVLVAVEQERKKRRAPVTRRFIVTEGIFEKDGAMADLPKIVRPRLLFHLNRRVDDVARVRAHTHAD
jgi:serine palmitoyltransferase